MAAAGHGYASSPHLYVPSNNVSLLYCLSYWSFGSRLVELFQALCDMMSINPNKKR
jgi:hypothetical protein